MPLQTPWISPEVVDQILSHGRAESPMEACGLILPNLRVVRLPNRHPTSPADSYLIEAEDLINVITEFIDEAGVDPAEVNRSHFVIWHTHPSGHVGPSRGDLDNRLEGFQYVVVTLPNGEATMF